MEEIPACVTGDLFLRFEVLRGETERTCHEIARSLARNYERRNGFAANIRSSVSFALHLALKKRQIGKLERSTGK